MKPKHFAKWAALLLTFAGLLHALRVILGWDLVISDWLVPVWLSAVVAVIALYLAWQGWKIAK